MPIMLDTLKHGRGAGGTGLFAPGPAAAAMAGTRRLFGWNALLCIAFLHAGPIG
jgi:hypothetical protein